MERGWVRSGLGGGRWGDAIHQAAALHCATTHLSLLHTISRPFPTYCVVASPPPPPFAILVPA